MLFISSFAVAAEVEIGKEQTLIINANDNINDKIFNALIFIVTP